MAKKVAPPRKPEPEANKQLVDAIIAVKHLQGFIQEHGTLERALAAVDRVDQLTALTGGVAALKQALQIVGQSPEESTAADAV